MSGEHTVRGSDAASRVPARGPGHGGDARGYSWEPFAEGNQVALKHGAYAVVQLQPRAREIATVLREMVPGWQPEFSLVVDRLAVIEARLERAEEALAERAYDEPAERIQNDLRLWLGLALRYYESLGLSPASRAKIRKDAGVAAAASVHAQRELEEHIAQTYGDVVEGDGEEAAP